MKIYQNFGQSADDIKSGLVGVLLTDTIYGLVAGATNKKAVQKVYSIKGRSEHKPLIILVSSFEDLQKFSVDINQRLMAKLEQFWPGPNTLIFPCNDEALIYLHRGKYSLAFRMPNNSDLLELIKKTGPIVAPSANPESLPPARNVDEAINYFDNSVDFYVDSGEARSTKPSTIYDASDNFKVLRK